MKQLKLRFAGPQDRSKIEQALRSNPINKLDHAILDYPTIQVLCAYGENEEHYLPVHRVLMLESLPSGITPSAIRDLTKGAELVASGHGIREMLFFDGAGGIGELAKHHGFEEVPYKVYRMRLK